MKTIIFIFCLFSVAFISSDLKAYKSHKTESRSADIECVDCDNGLKKDGWVDGWIQAQKNKSPGAKDRSVSSNSDTNNITCVVKSNKVAASVVKAQYENFTVVDVYYDSSADGFWVDIINSKAQKQTPFVKYGHPLHKKCTIDNYHCFISRDNEKPPRCNLRKADLRGADLRDADLRDADLRGANLKFADLHKADLRGADLRGADLRGANLEGVDLEGANLRGADLRYAYLRHAKLWGVNLTGVKFTAEQAMHLGLKKLGYSGFVIVPDNE